MLFSVYFHFTVLVYVNPLLVATPNQTHRTYCTFADDENDEDDEEKAEIDEEEEGDQDDEEAESEEGVISLPETADGGVVSDESHDSFMDLPPDLR